MRLAPLIASLAAATSALTIWPVGTAPNTTQIATRNGLPEYSLQSQHLYAKRWVEDDGDNHNKKKDKEDKKPRCGVRHMTKCFFTHLTKWAECNSGKYCDYGGPVTGEEPKTRHGGDRQPVPNKDERPEGCTPQSTWC